MNNILIFGSLPSGLGGMEKVFSRFSFLFHLNQEYEIKFHMYSLNNDNNLNWLSDGIKYTLFFPHAKFRFFQKMQICKNLSQYLVSNKPRLIISYDPLSIYFIRRVLDKLKLKIPVYSWLHFSLIEYKLKYQNYALLADKHLALCNSIKQQFITLGVEKSNIYTIYNPVSSKKIIIPKHQGQISKFLYIGRIQYGNQKNMQELFHALSKLQSDFTLDIIGDGSDDDKKQLLDLAEYLNIKQYIKWHGWQESPWQYVIDNIGEITALLMSSKYEGFPMILCEAISYGIYCISSNCQTGPTDIINDSNGELYQLGDINQLSDVLNKVQILSNTITAESIKNSIDYLYDENYYERVKNILIKSI